jgi:hypothetical protein
MISYSFNRFILYKNEENNKFSSNFVGFINEKTNY